MQANNVTNSINVTDNINFITIGGDLSGGEPLQICVDDLALMQNS